MHDADALRDYLGDLAILMAGTGITSVTIPASLCGMGMVTRPGLAAEPLC
jgi:hypothetical protein